MKWRATFANPLKPREKRSKLEKHIVELKADEGSGFALDVNVIRAIQDKCGGYINVKWVITEIALVPDDDVEIDWLIPYPYARLGFDPVKTSDSMVRRIFRDQLARTIWLAVRYRHIITTHYNQECLAAAKLIRKRKPETIHELQLIMRHTMPSHVSGIHEPFWTQFLPCITGQKQIGYAVGV